MTTRKEHVIEERWRRGGFHVEYFVRCRCGEVFTHYNRGKTTAMFREHQAAAEPAQ